MMSPAKDAPTCHLSHRHTVRLSGMIDAAFIGVTAAQSVIMAGYDAQDAAHYASVVDDGQVNPITVVPEINTEPDAAAGQWWHRVGARWRGLRESDRLADLVEPLTIMQKMTLIEQLGLNIPPPLLMGIAESRVHSAVMITPACVFVCRTVRLAVALPASQTDETGLIYDYDTIPLYLGHIDDPDNPTDLVELVSRPMVWRRPLECLVNAGHLFVLDVPEDGDSPAVHIQAIDVIIGT